MCRARVSFIFASVFAEGPLLRLKPLYSIIGIIVTNKRSTNNYSRTK